MLGIRLDAATEIDLSRVARLSGRTRSDIARDAIRAFLAIADRDEELDRELRAIAASTDDDLIVLDELNDELLAMIDREESNAVSERAA